jgi:hypothetical protein
MKTTVSLTKDVATWVRNSPITCVASPSVIIICSHLRQNKRTVLLIFLATVRLRDTSTRDTLSSLCPKYEKKNPNYCLSLINCDMQVSACIYSHNLHQQWLSNKSDLDSSVTGEVGRQSNTRMNLPLISLLHHSVWLMLGYVLNDMPCTSKSLLNFVKGKQTYAKYNISTNQFTTTYWHSVSLTFCQ